MSKRQKNPRAHSHRKKACEQADTITGEVTLEPRLLEILRLRVAQVCNCQLGIEVHTKALKDRGESAERIQQLQSWRESLLYDERERAALDMGEALCSDPARLVSKNIVHNARDYFQNGEVIQLTLAIFAVTDWSHQFAY